MNARKAKPAPAKNQLDFIQDPDGTVTVRKEGA
jgi:hypothetical protein